MRISSPLRIVSSQISSEENAVMRVGRARAVALVVALLVAVNGTHPAPAAPLPPDATLRTWIAEMKVAPRGPFANIAWFCNDGTVLPARAGCDGHDGGIQHGEWTDRVRAMRAGGFEIANVLAALDGAAFTGPDAAVGVLQQMLLERFLVAADDGWILRAALTYRGALQAADEAAGAHRILEALLADPAWRRDVRYYTLREAARLLPIEPEGMSDAATRIRQAATIITRKDPRFDALRVKIHGLPDATDADRVREYARTRGRRTLEQDYLRLADEIAALYTPGAAAEAALMLAEVTEDAAIADELRKQRDTLLRGDADARFRIVCHLAGLLRYNAPRWAGPRAGTALLRASLALEAETYAAGNTLLSALPRATRRQRLAWLRDGANALYGAGLIVKRHRDGLVRSVKRLEGRRSLTLEAYREELRYLARAAEWAGRTLVFHFSDAVAHFARIEPAVRLYPQDRLRGSPLLFYTGVIDSLVKDANRAAGIEHVIFGERRSSGLRALNPGLARGIVRLPTADARPADFSRDGIYLLPETTSEIAPVAGILTQGEGSSLSHVQLLARNLAIPNVVVGEALLPAIAPWDGQRAVLAVSPGGVVHLVADGPDWDRAFGSEAPVEFRIRPDLDKLDLDTRDLVPLTTLRAKDSGRTVGPKSANLGELKHRFGDAVPDGFVIPFGVFRALLDRPLEPGGPPVFAWMRDNYQALAARRGERAADERETRAFLARVRAWLESVELDPDFRTRLAAQLRDTFGPDGTYGVFVRSDTNVEDLPGFTGAGLNLTVPNVIGTENILAAIRQVWASPFTERSFAWRQAHMDDPENVFPAILVQRAVDADKSGVMVTTDVDGGRDRWITIAVNEGVGGAVDGQAAESLLVSTDRGIVRYLAQATATHRRTLAPHGGLAQVPVSGTEAVLADTEITQLIQLARDVSSKFPALRASKDAPAIADIEFAFRNGRLVLLQIRPFVENDSARRSHTLATLDAPARSRDTQVIALDAIPEG